MPLPPQFRKASAEIAETVRRNRRMIRQVADLCAGSERELEASYDLLRTSVARTTATKPITEVR